MTFNVFGYYYIENLTHLKKKKKLTLVIFAEIDIYLLSSSNRNIKKIHLEVHTNINLWLFFSMFVCLLVCFSINGVCLFYNWTLNLTNIEQPNFSFKVARSECKQSQPFCWILFRILWSVRLTDYPAPHDLH